MIAGFRTAVCGAEMWTVRKVGQKYLENFEINCWRRTEISWTDHEINETILQIVEEENNILPTIKQRKAKWIGHNVREECLVKLVIEGKTKGRIEVT